MGRVLLDITMSLDGFVTAPGADLAHGLGIGGEPLHDWVTDPAEADRKVLEQLYAEAGAILMGRRTFDVIDGPHGWEPVDGAPPVFVVTSRRPARVRLGDRFHFETDGITPALKSAQAAAGAKAVVVMGGGHLCRQYLYAGLVDEVRIHVAPIVLGDGTPLFERTTIPRIRLVQRDTVSTPNATHLTYDVVLQEK